MSKWIVCLARVFSKEQWAIDFIEKGKFRCNTLKYLALRNMMCKSIP